MRARQELSELSVDIGERFLSADTVVFHVTSCDTVVFNMF
jgi:hypothetical protein